MILFLLLVFILTAVFGRMFLQHKMTGDYGIRLAGKDSPPAHIAASVLLLVSGLIILFYIVSVTLGYLEPSFPPTLLQIAIGYSLYLSGSIIVLVSQHQMGTAWRIGVNADEKTELVTSGLFEHVRNPIYTGLFIGSVGLWLISPSMLFMLGLLSLYVAVELFVRSVEEPYLLEQFGAEYEEWYNSTPRYLPNFNL